MSFRPVALSWTFALGMRLLLPTPAHGVPLTAEDYISASQQRLSDSDLALSDPRLETSPEALVGKGYAWPPANESNRAGPFARLGESGFDFDPSHGATSTSKDVLRSFVLAERRSDADSNPLQVPRRSFGNAPTPALEAATREWIRDSVRDLVSSVLTPSVNDRGQASYSILGLGDFSTNGSGDHSEASLTAGNETLITGRRNTLMVPGAGNATGSGFPGSGLNDGPGSPRGSVDPLAGLSWIKQAIELVRDMATHPLAFLVYALVAIYVLIWTVLSSRKSRRKRVRTRHRHSHARQSADAPVHTAPKPRKRIRKRRRHRSTPSIQHE